MELTRTGAHTHTSTRPNSHSLIQTFPSELLLNIFKFAYVAAHSNGRKFSSRCSKDVCVAERKCYCDMEPSDECDECDEYDDHRPPSSLFPNSIASVCSRWGELMLLVPAFWTRIVVLLDADIFSSPNLQHQLRSSGNRPLDIIVTRTSFSDAIGLKDTEVTEQSRMAQAIMALRSHFYRCRTFKVEVIYSSSLPRLVAVLPSNMPYLRTLSLESCIDSGRPGVQPYCFLDRATPFVWCSLTTVLIDGWNLSDLHDRNPTPDNRILSTCNSLSVIFGELSGTRMGRLSEGCPSGSLVVDSVTTTPDIDLATTAQGGDLIHFPNLRTITLKNLNREATTMILPYVCASALSLTIDNCVLPSFPLESNSGRLDLQNIGLDQGLGDLIRFWNGADLQVARCPGLDDDALEKLGSNDNKDFTVNWAYTLTIADCHGFSVVALKELVKRKANFCRNCPLLDGLYVYQAGFSLSEEDHRWFKESIPKFQWEA